MVDAHLRGAEPRVRDGLQVAWQRRWPILGWAVLASGVGSVLNALQQFPGVEWIGRLIGCVGGLAWGLATFLVVPVLAVEGLGPVASVRRSAGVFRQRWGEALTANLTIGAVVGIAMVPGFAAMLAGLIAFGDNSWGTGVTLLSVGIVLLAPLMALEAALTQLFQYALFRQSTQGELPRLFTPADVDAAFTPVRRRVGLLVAALVELSVISTLMSPSLHISVYMTPICSDAPLQIRTHDWHPASAG